MQIDFNTFSIDLAGHIIEIHSSYPVIYGMCKGWLTDGKPDFSIYVQEIDIVREANISSYPIDNDGYRGYLEALAIHRAICENMLSFSTFLMHGAVVSTNDSAFMFTAKSGTGKTTHIQKWLEYAPNSVVVNGDKPLIKLTDTEAIAYGTPWCGKERLGSNIGVPLRAIVLMERDENNEIEEITFSQAFPTLLQQTYRPADANKMRKTLALLSALYGKMKFYHFRFNNMKPDAFRTSYEALTGKKIDSDV